MVISSKQKCGGVWFYHKQFFSLTGGLLGGSLPWLLESRKFDQCGWKLVTMCKPFYTGSKTKERVGKNQVEEKRYA